MSVVGMVPIKNISATFHEKTAKEKNEFTKLNYKYNRFVL
jgi:hypothetical protein